MDSARIQQLIETAMTPGPMQGMARALIERYAQDEQVEETGRRSREFDPNAYYDAIYPEEYANAGTPIPGGGGTVVIPEGDRSEEETRAGMAERAALKRLMEQYDRRGWAERAGDVMGQLASDAFTLQPVAGQRYDSVPAVDLVRDTFAPGFSQADSLRWANENFDKYIDLRERDPLTALGYLPLSALGYVGSVPGLSAIIGGARKAGLGAQLAYEGLF